MTLDREDLLSEKLSWTAHKNSTQAANLNPSLCDKCRFIFEQSIPAGDRTDIQHHENGESILQAAKHCHVCFAITYGMGHLWASCKLPLKWTIRTYSEDHDSPDSAASTTTAVFSYGITIDFSKGDIIGGTGPHFSMRSQRG